MTDLIRTESVKSWRLSFVINFAGIPEKETTETNFIGLKISTTSFEVQRPTDYSFVKIYEFPFELKNSKKVADRLIAVFSCVNTGKKNSVEECKPIL
jgi:hypothetical protein